MKEANRNKHERDFFANKFSLLFGINQLRAYIQEYQLIYVRSSIISSAPKNSSLNKQSRFFTFYLKIFH